MRNIKNKILPQGYSGGKRKMGISVRWGIEVGGRLVGGEGEGESVAVMELLQSGRGAYWDGTQVMRI